MNYKQLGQTDLFLSELSYGASGLGGVFGAFDQKKGREAVYTALEAGVNYIDTAPYYGDTRSESFLGQVLKDIPRDDFIISTKAGRYGLDDFDYSEKRIRESLDESLFRLQLDEVDMLLLHDIEFGDYSQIVNESLPVLQDLKKQGKIKAYGVSALPLDVLRKVTEDCDLDFVLSYCRHTLNDSSLGSILPFFKDHGVGVINASPVGMGLLSEDGPMEWHTASDTIRNACRQACQFCSAQGKCLTKLAVQFSAKNDLISSTLVGAVNPEYISQNIAWIEENIDSSLLQEVMKILSPIRNQSWAA